MANFLCWSLCSARLDAGREEGTIERDDLVTFANYQPAPSDHRAWGSYSLEDGDLSSYVYLSLVEDPDVPGLLNRFRRRDGKNLIPGVNIGFPVRHFTFALSVAAKIVSQWDGIADVGNVSDAILAIAEREHLPLLRDGDRLGGQKRQMLARTDSSISRSLRSPIPPAGKSPPPTIVYPGPSD